MYILKIYIVHAKYKVNKKHKLYKKVIYYLKLMENVVIYHYFKIHQHI